MLRQQLTQTHPDDQVEREDAVLGTAQATFQRHRSTKRNDGRLNVLDKNRHKL